MRPDGIRRQEFKGAGQAVTAPVYGMDINLVLLQETDMFPDGITADAEITPQASTRMKPAICQQLQ